MRWKTGHHEHDPRHIDLIAVFALLILIVAACRFLSRSDPPATTAFIAPSQSVRREASLYRASVPVARTTKTRSAARLPAADAVALCAPVSPAAVRSMP